MKKLKISPAQAITVGFILLLFIILRICGLSVGQYVTLSLNRICMYMVIMLSIIPTIYSGAGINYGVTLGFVCGLGGAVIGINMGLTGLKGFLACILFSIPIAVALGWVYGRVLNMVKGSEAVIATYVGFMVISIGSIVWMMLNVQSSALRFPNGSGVRDQVALDSTFRDIVYDWLPLRIGADLVIPVGSIVVCLGVCFLFWVFTKSHLGVKIKLCGDNPAYASALGLKVDRYRTISTVVSTCIAAGGIHLYAQAYGYYQFYALYQTLGFACVAGVLIGGGNFRKVSVFNVIYGCVVFETILTISTPVANQLIKNGALPDILRTLITNGVVLYALTKGGKKARA